MTIVGKFVLIGDPKEELMSIAMGKVLWEDSRQLLVQYLPGNNKGLIKKTEVLATSAREEDFNGVRQKAYAICNAAHEAMDKIRKLPVTAAFDERNEKLRELFKASEHA